MNKNIQIQICKDIYRFYGKEKLNIREKLLMENELKYIILYRKVNGVNNKLLKIYYRFRLYLMSRRTMIQIPHKTKIGDGFYIGHCGRIIINHNAIIGKNVNISTGVTIGKTNRGKNAGVPIIGDKVWIGTNAVVVGKIKIGNNVLIAPNSYVNFDVPDNSIVIGNPGVIKSKINAVDGYICNCIE